MSAQPQTYSPAQYLDAGFRAEMAGERDRAAQYYTYLAEAFPETPEGEAARGGLMRLGLGPRGAPGSQPYWETAQADHAHGADGHAPPAQATRQATPRTQPPPAGQAPHQRRPAQQPSQSDAAASAAANAAGQRIRLGDLARQDTARPGMALPQAASAHDLNVSNAAVDAGEPMRLPEVVARRARELAEGEESLGLPPRYRGARTLARLIAVLGWILAAAGIALVMLAFTGLAGGGMGSGFGMIGGIGLGLGAISSGCIMALGGRVALAIFDQSDHMREISILLRARDGF